MPIRKLHLILLLAVIVSPVFAQVNTNSPYSRFGLGQLTLPGYGQSQAMGAAGIALRSNKQINYINPAASTAIDTMSFLFDFGLNASYTNYETTDLNSSLTNFNLDHLAIGFAISKWWKATAGIGPFSSVGYNILDQRTLPNIGLVDYSFEGNGGLTNFYLGTSVMLFKKISLGINMSNVFGYLQNSQRTDFPADAEAAQTYADNRMVVRDQVFTFGLQYHEILKNKYFITIGAIYENQTSLKTKQTLLYQNFFPGTPVALNDSTVANPNFELDKTITEGDVIYPQRYGAGISLGLVNKLTLTGDYQVQNWSNALLMGRNDSLVNSSSMNFGMEYTPDQEALRGYLNRVHYRLGGYYSNSYLRIRGEQLKDYGITFGVGLPFRGTKTTFNLGMVLGQRGTTDNNLIKENYGIIQFSFTLHDFWFFKRKFD
jgi:hypothetical protein